MAYGDSLVKGAEGWICPKFDTFFLLYPNFPHCFARIWEGSCPPPPRPPDSYAHAASELYALPGTDSKHMSIFPSFSVNGTLQQLALCASAMRVLVLKTPHTLRSSLTVSYSHPVNRTGPSGPRTIRGQIRNEQLPLDDLSLQGYRLISNHICLYVRLSVCLCWVGVADNHTNIHKLMSTGYFSHTYIPVVGRGTRLRLLALMLCLN